MIIREAKPADRAAWEPLWAGHLEFYNSELQYAAEPGEFEVFCGTDSSNLKKAKFTLL